MKAVNLLPERHRPRTPTGSRSGSCLRRPGRPLRAPRRGRRLRAHARLDQLDEGQDRRREAGGGAATTRSPTSSARTATSTRSRRSASPLSRSLAENRVRLRADDARGRARPADGRLDSHGECEQRQLEHRRGRHSLEQQQQQHVLVFERLDRRPLTCADGLRTQSVVCGHDARAAASDAGSERRRAAELRRLGRLGRLPGL